MVDGDNLILDTNFSILKLQKYFKADQKILARHLLKKETWTLKMISKEQITMSNQSHFPLMSNQETHTW